MCVAMMTQEMWKKHTQQSIFHKIIALKILYPSGVYPLTAISLQVSNVRLEYCMLIRWPQGDLFFKNELVYVQCICMKPKEAGR